MTQTEWLSCIDPTPMLDFVKDKASDRKLRLFACACCRRIWPLLSDKRVQLAVDVGEKCADGEATDEQQFLAYEAACDAMDDAWCGAYENSDFPAVAASYVVANDPPAALVAAMTATAGDNPMVRQPEEMAVQCNLLRDFFGSLFFRPVTIAPQWLRWQDGIVVKLAQAIYEERAFERLPILADVLEEAGCSNAEILTHCRQPREHFRGCWVLDMSLGKK